MAQRQMGPFEAIGRAIDDSGSIAAALAMGTLTRGQIQDWYERRRQEGEMIAGMARERASMAVTPVRNAAEVGREVAQGFMNRTRTAVRPRRRRRRHER